VLLLAGCGGGGSAGGNSSSLIPGGGSTPPQVDAGADFAAQESRNASLVGKVLNSSGSIMTTQWAQLSGPPVTLQYADTLYPSFTVPSYALGIAPITFQLSVTDSNGLSSSDTVVVSITPEWWQMQVQNEYAYSATMSMVGGLDFIELVLDPNQTYDIVLRTFVGNGGLFVYSSNTLLPSQLLAQSVGPDIKNAIQLSPTGLSKVYLEVAGGYGNQYTLTVRAHSPFLEPGFPADTTLMAGTWQGGAEHRAVTIGNIDSDPELEILFSGVALGPLYAFNHDGTAVNGWPVAATTDGAAYPSIGELDGNTASREIVAGFGPYWASCSNDQYLFTGAGVVMPGWPKMSCHAGSTTPSLLADINNDGVDEVFFEGGRGFYADGTAIAAWPGFLELKQPSYGDVNGDGQPELVFSDVAAYALDGTMLPGFPATVDLAPLNTIIAGPVGLADLDGTGGKEIIRILKVQDNPSYLIVQAFSGSGALLWQRQTVEGVGWRVVPSFADLNGDGRPEVLVQTDEQVYAWDGTGTLLPNFPFNYAVATNLGSVYTGNLGASAPLIADVTGDNLTDIIVAGASYLAIYDTSGVLQQKIRILDNHVMSAVADIDMDGRNEIVMAEADSLWHGHNYEDVGSIWVYDLGGPAHGAIQWGQLGGSTRHQFSFPPIQ
jgi:hypothetical protein